MDAVEVIRRVGKLGGVKRAFGEPYEHDGALVIPVAVVAGGAGGGGDDAGGGGGGGGTVTWPLGVYVVRDGTARWVPAIDATRVVLAVIATARVAVKVRAMRVTSARRATPGHGRAGTG